ncbi:hypothetical protein SAMN05892877_106223 [Rhizobium subbaraonis]|uniref:Uncharacterized protein n=1 Tax=Rhizobium subbaraonis TaxID=908946 RepID=A0A285UDU6_9HYPH|nr:hypothetical protein [Rhizobium subbaraonis]SOC39847.1 hypothetical protein SAMN05892877_106223 [Rhizobium subbaraonis]
MNEQTPQQKTPAAGTDLVERYRPLGLKAIIAAALQLKDRRRDASVPNA